MSWCQITRLVISAVAVVGNGLLVWIIGTRTKLHNTANWFILSLAVSDFFVGFFISPIDTACGQLKNCDIYLERAFDELFLYASICNLCAMIMERYASIVHPLKYPIYFTPTRAFCLIGTAWGIPILNLSLHFPWLYAEPTTKLKWYRIFTVIETIVLVTTPCMLLVAANVRICQVALYHSRKTAAQMMQLGRTHNRIESSAVISRKSSLEANDAIKFRNTKEVPEIMISNVNMRTTGKTTDIKENLKKQKAKTSSVKIITSVTAIFLICWSLSLYVSFCQFFIRKEPSPTTRNVSWLLMLLNSAVNLFVYALFKSDIRGEFSLLFSCGVLSRKQGNKPKQATTRQVNDIPRENISKR